jgi:hypothetical protein
MSMSEPEDERRATRQHIRTLVAMLIIYIVTALAIYLLYRFAF